MVLIKFLSVIRTLAPILSEFFNECYRLGIFPNTLKIGRVTPIDKSGDASCRTNYRPITILNIMAKLFEKLTYNRLTKYIQKHNILKHCQFGFRKHHSTTHAITTIYERILNNIENSSHTATIYLDLSKAFDCVNHKILFQKLQHYGIRGHSLQFFKSYLSNRKQFTIVNGEISDILNVICGVPQCSPLGPLRFLLYITNLANTSKF